MSTNQTKVYCGQCRWFRPCYGPTRRGAVTISHSGDICVHVTNTALIRTYRAFSRGMKWTPSEKNATNDCPLCEPIPPKKGFIERLVALMTYTKMDRSKND